MGDLGEGEERRETGGGDLVFWIGVGRERMWCGWRRESGMLQKKKARMHYLVAGDRH